MYLASCSADKTVLVWDVAMGVTLQIPEDHFDTVYTAASSPDGEQLASGSRDGTVRVWDVAGETLQTFKKHTDLVSSVAFSPDGKHLVSGSHDRTLRVWDLRTGAISQILRGHSDWVLACAFSPDGKQLISGSKDMTVRVCDVATGATLQQRKVNIKVEKLSCLNDGLILTDRGRLDAIAPLAKAVPSSFSTPIIISTRCFLALDLCAS
jgi:WD40 repeat protein